MPSPYAPSHRGVVVASRGAVASSQPLATAAGLAVLERGGSFADAAIAMSAVLCVVEPWNSHLGGDAFLIVHDAESRTNTAFNGSGEAPARATPESFPDGIPLHGPRATTVPGLVSTWFAFHERHGTRPIAELLRTAISYASDGFPAGPRMLLKFAGAATLLAANPSLAALGAGPDVRLGQTIVQPDLAWTLEQIARNGRDAFYRGEIMRKMVDASEGWTTDSDFTNHRTRIEPPISTRYRHLTVHGQPPPSQGMILIEELAIANGWDLRSWSETDRIHALVEAKKCAFADRNAFLCDPEFHSIPLEKLLGQSSIAARRAGIAHDRAADNCPPATIDEGADTTYFLVRDNNGNSVSFIQSVFHNFGAAWIAEGTGVLFNNRATGFSTAPESVNAIAPGKRPAHTLNAWLATHDDGSLALVGGTPGGHIQVQTNLQLIVNSVDLELDPQAAVEAPRWQHLAAGGSVSSEESGPGILEIEDRADPAVVDALRSRGHDIRPIGAWAHGSAAQLLQVLPSGASAVGSDPRCDGHAAGL